MKKICLLMFAFLPWTSIIAMSSDVEASKKDLQPLLSWLNKKGAPYTKNMDDLIHASKANPKQSCINASRYLYIYGDQNLYDAARENINPNHAALAMEGYRAIICQKKPR